MRRQGKERRHGPISTAGARERVRSGGTGGAAGLITHSSCCSMGTHMKTTIEIADPLFEEAKKLAAEQHTTLRELVEQGLRRAIAERKQPKPFKLEDKSVDGDGPTAEWLASTRAEKRALIYGDRE